MGSSAALGTGTTGVCTMLDMPDNYTCHNCLHPSVHTAHTQLPASHILTLHTHCTHHNCLHPCVHTTYTQKHTAQLPATLYLHCTYTQSLLCLRIGLHFTMAPLPVFFACVVSLRCFPNYEESLYQVSLSLGNMAV